jgi:hypothetical protein
MARRGRPPKRYDAEAWKVGFSEYTQSYEVRLYRRQDTYGGKLWPQDHRPGTISEQKQLQIAIQAMERTA